MATVAEVLPALSVGSAFTALGLFKVWGLVRGIEGGRDKPFGQYVCGS